MSPRSKESFRQMRNESLNKITQAALRIFAEYGYHGATLKKITNETGLSYGLVYHYFPTKQDIFLHLVDIALTYSKTVFDKIAALPGTAWEKLVSLSETMIHEMQKEEMSYQFVIVQQAMTIVKDIPEIGTFIQDRIGHYALMDELISDAQKEGMVIEGKPSVLSASYLALIQGLAMLMLIEKDLRTEISPDILNNLLLKK